jgi:hypothetical protein
MRVCSMVVVPVAIPLSLLYLAAAILVCLLCFPSASALSSSIEHRLAKNAIPIKAVGIHSAAAQLIDVGVCRIDGVLSKTTCNQVRDSILSMREGPMTDMRNILGTRLRFDEPVIVPLGKRNDILLPIEDSKLNEVLTELMEKLGGILEEAAEILPGSAAGETFQKLELVEVGCLVSEPGSTHQSLHADFRRDVNNPNARLPPRLVTFIYLQDVPTSDHGPTIFLPSTNNKESHRSYHSEDSLDRESVHSATLNCGDVAIYDASLLHFGSANSIPGNTRAVLYFGVGLKDAAALCASGGDFAALENLEPISVMTGVDGKRYLSHSSIKGMAARLDNQVKI